MDKGAISRGDILKTLLEYDSKAVAGVAHKHRQGRALTWDEFSGGERHAVDWLKREGAGGPASRRSARSRLGRGPHRAHEHPGRPVAAPEGAHRLHGAAGRRAARGVRGTAEARNLPQRPRIRRRGPTAQGQPAPPGPVGDPGARGTGGTPDAWSTPGRPASCWTRWPSRATGGRHLRAFFGCLYHAGLRPGEAVWLRRVNCDLPLNGWGTLHLDGSRPRVGSSWTDSGASHDERGLKWRPNKTCAMSPSRQHS